MTPRPTCAVRCLHGRGLAMAMTSAGLVALTLITLIRSRQRWVTVASDIALVPSDFSITLSVPSHFPAWIDHYIQFHRSPNTGGTRFLVWACEPHHVCGGIGDQARGMISAFYLALLTGRKLLIVDTNPCDIAIVLRPAHIDWRRHAPDVLARADLETTWINGLAQDLFQFFDGTYDGVPTITLRTNVAFWPLLMNSPRYADHRRRLNVRCPPIFITTFRFPFFFIFLLGKFLPLAKSADGRSDRHIRYMDEWT